MKIKLNQGIMKNTDNLIVTCVIPQLALFSDLMS